MTPFIHILRRIPIPRVLLVCIVIVVLLPDIPLLHPIPGRDSGVFLYAGQRLLQGVPPYESIWDHKPPAIFFIDAVGLLLGQGSLWGVWLLEIASLIFATLIGYTLLRRIFGTVPALIASVWSLITLAFLLEGGNLTEDVLVGIAQRGI